MDKFIIPFEAALNCTSCGSVTGCRKRCDTFYKLMHAMVDIHSQYEKLQKLAMKEENSDDQELEVLSTIMNRLERAGLPQ